MRRNLIISQLFLVITAFICIGAPQVAIRLNSTGEKVMIPVFETKGTSTLVPLPQLFEKLGYTCQWDRYLQQLTCTQKQSKVVFIQDNPFYTVNGVVFQCPTEPVRSNGSICLPLTVVADWLKPFSKVAFQIDTASKAGKSADTLPKANKPIDISSKVNKPIDTSSKIVKAIDTVSQVTKSAAISAKRSILSAVSEKKKNGTLVTLQLTDSLPFEYTYFYPNLTINFTGGIVDTHALKQENRIGLVDSIFALQYKQSAQVSIILNRPIEEPLIDYIEDTHTLLLAIRQKKVKKAVPANLTNVVPQKDIGIEGVKTIVLDPGHGGKDPGATGITGVLEKDVVLAIGLKVRELIKKQDKLKVLMTRDKDIFIPLSDRTKFANDKQADLFISIHADAVPGPLKRKENAKGYKIYFLSQAKNEEDKLVAMRENAVIELEEKPQNYSNLQNVLIDLAGNEYLKESQDICIFLDQKFESSLDKKICKLHLGVGQANFWVLNGAYMPSVLIETGFLSNPTEEKLLSDKKFQSQMAMAIYEAVLAFKSKYENGL